MSRALRRRLGQLVVAGFAGRTIPVELRALAREFDLGGVILFARNVEAPMQVAELAGEVRALPTELPTWVSVDQEGGRVQRLRAPCTEWPPIASLGRSGDPDLARRFGRALARELRSLGITLDYAPVLDVDTNPHNPVIGDRAPADDPSRAAVLGAAMVRALQGGGVAACGKHFPGHGDTDLDSHKALPIVEHDRGRLEEVELPPFRAAIEAEVAALMTAHVQYPALDESSPATLSHAVVTGLLRGDLGFNGWIVTDDLTMGAITVDHTVPDAAVEAVCAGCDSVLLCDPDPEAQAAVIERLIRAVEDKTLTERQVEDALRRQRRAKERFLDGDDEWRPPPPRVLDAVLGCDEHQSIADEMRRHL
ncbi:MAG: beta-N-acetylhexosaminidase [Acidobacteria bacterium]|nr:beta-N-acetylhexosaminidase [Acidobacteriota bacterium]